MLLAVHGSQIHVCCLLQTPTTVTDLLIYDLQIATNLVASGLQSQPNMPIQDFWGAAVALAKLNLALATAVGCLAVNLPQPEMQLVNMKAMQHTYNFAGILHAIVEHAAKAQPETLENAEDADAATAIAASAAALICFARLECRGGIGPDNVVRKSLPSGMQIAAVAAGVLHRLARQLGLGGGAAARSRSALASAGAAAVLRQLLSWIAEPPTAVATSSAVLAEALPALAALAEGDEAFCSQLAAKGGPYEWAPVAAALRRRLPRRMATRFLPEVDCVTAAVAKAGSAASSLGALHL